MKPLAIVAEMSCNHLGSLDRAFAIVDAAANAGATHVKLQCWTPGTMCVSDYVIPSGPWRGRQMRDLYEQCFTPWAWFRPLFDRISLRGMTPFASAFDLGAVDFLESIGCPIHKVSSFEITDLRLIKHMAQTGKPIVLSTGSATFDEIGSAFSAACYGAEPDVTILKCTSAYPAPIEDANLVAMKALGAHFPCDYGLSDHTEGIGVAIAAAALGATMIEKHLTLWRSDGGPDAGFSMEPAEFARMSAACRSARKALGTVKYGDGDRSMKRSVYAIKDIAAGERFTAENVTTARPGLGVSASDLEWMFEQECRDWIKAGEPVTWKHLPPF